MEKTSQILRTKLHMPFIRSGLVSRPRLLEQMTIGLRLPLILVAAPAGFGKTTLVASSVSSMGMPVAWLSLDKSDNQEWRFLSYLIAALQEADASIGCEAALLLDEAQRATPESILTSIINDLGALTRDMILVLDDYQLIKNQAVHEAVIFLLEHCPRTFHLIIATRSDPPLSLARLRARSQLVELRTADLRFTRSEAARFLNDVMALNLDARAVEILEARTEGWITGLQMASIAMQSRLTMPGPLAAKDTEDIRSFIDGFSGTNRYIIDYLLEEVLAVQTPEIQRFLLYTSILERLNAPLCDAILAEGKDKDQDSHGSAAHVPGTSTSILEYLERANLFLIALDDERKWYRYHHLFADLLRARLQQSLNTGEVATLHIRAGQWYEQHDLVYDAILHASLISKMEWVERLIEKNYLEMFRRTELASIRFLTGSLSKEMVYKRPWLCIYEAESRAWFGELDEADRLLSAAQKHIQSADASFERQAMLGHMNYIQSRVTAMRGDLHTAIDLCITAQKNTPAGNHALQCGIGVMLGYGYFLNGDFQNAVKALNETIRSGIASGVISTTIAAYCVLARLYVVQGRLHKAFQAYQEAQRYAQNEGSGHRGGNGIVDVGIAAILYEWNDLEAASRSMTNGIAFIPYWRKADDVALAYTTLAQIQSAQGNQPEALESMQKASQAVHDSGVFSEARDAVAAMRTRLNITPVGSLAADQLSEALENKPGTSDPFQFQYELARITLERAALIQKKAGKGLELLAGLEENAQNHGRTGRLIEILILKALALHQSGLTAQALKTLEKGLALAEPEGYIRSFIDEGKPMQFLLAQWLANAGPSPLRNYAAKLLSCLKAAPQAFMIEKGSHATGIIASPVPDEPVYLVEPLSQREMEVLHLMASGNTNQEIARQLIVAPGTVKAHAASIYRKLDVANRTEAVTRAQQLGILRFSERQV